MADDKIAELKREAEEIKAKIKAEKDAKRDTTLVEFCKGIRFGNLHPVDTLGG